MAGEVLPGEKKIMRVSARLEEREREIVRELADRRGMSQAAIIREGIRQLGNAQAPEGEKLEPFRRGR